MKDHRPDPEKLLKRIQEEEQQEQRGKLKIYLGAAPGVGKTHTMLEDAFDKRSKGLDVVVGIVETHHRREIEFLLSEFEIIPRQTVQYHGQALEEFDIDAVLKRNPAIVLIDEMAHTNVPGLRHAKRWQDIKEIIDRGIDVYTTLNVQHIESLNDIVSQIIHTRVKEVVPDIMLEGASIELVDIPPEDLLKRLHDGKVYYPAQADIAKDHFFQKGNLIALRELALRVTAESVSKQVLLYRQGLGIQYIWPTRDKLLVCVSHKESSGRLLRVAKRLASRLEAEWIAIHVETAQLQLSEEERNAVRKNLQLAEKLGAEIRTLVGINIVHEIIAFAHEQNITEIVIWKQIRPRWKEFLSRSLADEIVRHSGEIDVYVVTSERTNYPKEPGATPKYATHTKPFWISLATIGVTTALCSFLQPFLDLNNLLMIYMLAITFVASMGFMTPAIIASILSVICFNFFFVPPYHQLDIGDLQYLFTILISLVIAITISNLTFLSRRQASGNRLREKYTNSLHLLSKSLASTRGVDKLLEKGVNYIADLFNSDVMALLPNNNQLAIRTKNGLSTPLNDKELSVAAWVYDIGQVAGLGTDTLPFSDAIYIPLLAAQTCIGVLRVRPSQSKSSFSSDEIHLLEACANQVAIAIEVDKLYEQSKQSELKSENDHTRNKLLQSVSHSLRTPLVVAMGATTTLLEMGKKLDASTVLALTHNIYNELDQLNRLINNLLQITYLEAESIKLQKQYYSLRDVIEELIHSESKLNHRQINLSIPNHLPLIPFDKTLIHEVLINLLDNAIQFTPDDTPITVSAIIDKNNIVVSIEDQGPGIVLDEVNQLFEKFYRGRMLTSKRGLGLGLAICRHIVNAHGGVIWAENRKEGGAIFRFTLPLTL